ncbi:unnamed protein product [Didymodactylos carnosus]|uniref:Uncharacterized protein n=2 Tax=Didymodactylos carnosus TaxID=1234261 RepID=A0A8S2LLX3_9BILA|nr:unnamed protein product [Didymodactylos carnosus]CAF3906874.1 unnamed protein product [Didymodactylos carnosus]
MEGIFTNDKNDKSQISAYIQKAKQKELYSCFSELTLSNVDAYLQSRYFSGVDDEIRLRWKMVTTITDVRRNIHYVSFKNECLNNDLRQHIPLAKLMYFYLIDRKRMSVTDMFLFDDLTHPTQIEQDPTCLNGYCIRFNDHQRLRGAFYSIIPGNYEIIWRLKAVKISDSTEKWGTLSHCFANPDFGTPCCKTFYSPRRGKSKWLPEMEKKNGWCLQSIGTFVVFETSTVYFSIRLHMTPYWAYAIYCDYVELKVVEYNNSNYLSNNT